MKQVKSIKQEFREANPGEVGTAIRDNFIFGFSGAVIVPFIAMRIDIAVLICYLFHFFFISKVIKKYPPKFIPMIAGKVQKDLQHSWGARKSY